MKSRLQEGDRALLFQRFNLSTPWFTHKYLCILKQFFRPSPLLCTLSYDKQFFPLLFSIEFQFSRLNLQFSLDLFSTMKIRARNDDDDNRLTIQVCYWELFLK